MPTTSWDTQELQRKTFFSFFGYGSIETLKITPVCINWLFTTLSLYLKKYIFFDTIGLTCVDRFMFFFWLGKYLTTVVVFDGCSMKNKIQPALLIASKRWARSGGGKTDVPGLAVCLMSGWLVTCTQLNDICLPITPKKKTFVWFLFWDKTKRKKKFVFAHY